MADDLTTRVSDQCLLYGPSASGKLRRWQQRKGGRLLTDLPKPMHLSFVEFSLQTLESWRAQRRQVLFDLTNVAVMTGVLDGRGPHADSVTAHELRYLRSRWADFETTVTFYRNDEVVEAPW